MKDNYGIADKEETVKYRMGYASGDFSRMK